MFSQRLQVAVSYVEQSQVCQEFQSMNNLNQINFTISRCQSNPSGSYQCHLIASTCASVVRYSFFRGAGFVLNGTALGACSGGCVLWWGVGCSHSCSQMHTWCHLSRSVIPPCGKRSGPRLDHEIGHKSRAAASWRWGLTHRKQSVRGFSVWIVRPAGRGYLRAVLHWLGFRRERRMETEQGNQHECSNRHSLITQSPPPNTVCNVYWCASLCWVFLAGRFVQKRFTPKLEGRGKGQGITHQMLVQMQCKESHPGIFHHSP